MYEIWLDLYIFFIFLDEVIFHFRYIALSGLVWIFFDLSYSLFHRNNVTKCLTKNKAIHINISISVKMKQTTQVLLWTHLNSKQSGVNSVDFPNTVGYIVY